MTSSVDSRIVAMKIDNKQFESGATQTLGTLAKLKAALGFDGASKGLTDVQSAANRFNLGPIGTSIESVNKAFLGMAAVATTALVNITNRAVDAGIQLGKSLTIDPLKSGLAEYETNLNSIQTILANTSVAGSDLNDVNKALDELNSYSDKTIYNFSEMARNIGTFTAAGVGLDESVKSIKGIANLAALSGSNSQQASSAMYQLSQAIASGRVSLMDWNSVVNAGMGGSVFQRALAQTAVAMGEIDENAVKLKGEMKNVTVNGQSFRDSISAASGGGPSWLTSKVLTNTLAQFTGDLDKAALKAQGFNDEQIKAIQKQAEMATKAATEVKTLSGVIDVARESAGSGWAKTWQLIFGDFNQAKKTFTDLSETISGFISGNAKARNAVLKAWGDLGGRAKLIEGIKNIFGALKDVLLPIKAAFEEIFPPMTGKRLFQLTKAFEQFTAGLKPSLGTMTRLKDTFAGVFAVFDIVKRIIGSAIGTIFDLFGAMSDGSGSVLDFTAGVGDWLVAFNEALKKGKSIEKFFAALGDILKVPIALIQDLAGMFFGLFDGMDNGKADKASEKFSSLNDRIEQLTGLGEKIAEFGGKIGEFFGDLLNFLEPVVDAVANVFSGLFDAIAEGISTGNFDSVIDILNTGLLAGILLLVKRFLTKGLGDLGGGIVGNFSQTLNALTGSLQAMQANIQAGTLLKIAGAVALLAASLLVLSTIPSKQLSTAISGLTLLFAQLVGTLLLLSKIDAGAIKFPLIAGGLVILSGALLILSGVVKILASMSWKELGRGLAGVTALLAALSGTALVIGKSAGGMVAAGVGITAMSLGLKVLASVVADFAEMSWKDIGKGLAALTGVLTALSAAMMLMPASTILIGPGLVAVAFAIKIIGSALESMSQMGWEEIGKGLTVLGGALALIAAALNVIPPWVILIGPGLIAVAIAIGIIGDALAKMAEMGWKDIGKSMVVLGGSLAILAAALNLMSGAVTGALALVIAAGALRIMLPVLTKLGKMSWTEIGKGLVALAGAFAVIGVAGLLLTPLILPLLGLGAALALIGAGLALAGAGALAFATAFTMIAVAGAAGAEALGMILESIGEAIPSLMTGFARGIIDFAEVIEAGAPSIIGALEAMLGGMLDAVNRLLPKVFKLFRKLGQGIIDVTVDLAPDISEAGWQVVLAFLEGVREHIDEVIEIGTEIVVKIIVGLEKANERFTRVTFRMIIKFCHALADTIRANGEKLGRAGGDIANAIVDGLLAALKGAAEETGTGSAYKVSMGLGLTVLKGLRDSVDSHSPSREAFKIGQFIALGLIGGINNKSKAASDAAETMGKGAMAVLKTAVNNARKDIPNELDIAPKITPILDLTQLQNEASKIQGHLSGSHINPRGHLRMARNAASEHEDVVSARAERQNVEHREIKFEQNNNSPKALSHIEIYRNTKSLLAMAKEALDS